MGDIILYLSFLYGYFNEYSTVVSTFRSQLLLIQCLRRCYYHVEVLVLFSSSKNVYTINKRYAFYEKKNKQICVMMNYIIFVLLYIF